MRSTSNAQYTKRAYAFTLVEMLVTLAVVALLVGLFIPALARARSSARQSVCLSNLRGISTVLESYLERYDDTYPFVRFNQPLAVEPPDEGGGEMAWDDPWKLIIYWPATMHTIAPWRQYFEAWICPGSDRQADRPWVLAGGAMGMSSYSYSRSFQAAPVLWTSRAEKDPSLIRAIRSAEVQFPSSKVIMFDRELAHMTPQERRNPSSSSIPMLFGDGHARSLRRTEATPPSKDNPFVDDPVSLHDTPDGVSGRDY